VRPTDGTTATFSIFTAAFLAEKMFAKRHNSLSVDSKDTLHIAGLKIMSDLESVTCRETGNYCQVIKENSAKLIDRRGMIKICSKIVNNSTLKSIIKANYILRYKMFKICLGNLNTVVVY
jgi:hypothetical protein